MGQITERLIEMNIMEIIVNINYIVRMMICENYKDF